MTVKGKRPGLVNSPHKIPISLRQDPKRTSTFVILPLTACFGVLKDFHRSPLLKWEGVPVNYRGGP